ncbi:putative mitochondrial import inner membrane translocase subunit 50 [Tieghemostelium lacteum]|uniref:Mitochondrial import inner membrane translocase subunit TIM50 n=1 Tax=Tieghemostelium lacteum TaxID=361077 RepID=A0A152A3K6_TIELA|nr:putative mitochondrial import inner membrane translocase subunit 50 [Tieghemostelium lacteum]|eukprot:KYR00843.1 putative mitochondrial import inner membrane translocase subunit 50 [Tieghemostelium lacteum]
MLLSTRVIRNVLSGTKKFNLASTSSFGNTTLPFGQNYGPFRNYAKSNSKSSKEKEPEETEKKEEFEEEEDGESEKKPKYELPPYLKTATSTILLATLFSSATIYVLYNYKKDITEEERLKLGKVQTNILTNLAIPVRTSFDNIYANLLRENKTFESFFGPAPLQQLLGPPLPSGVGRQYTLVIDLDSILEISRSNNHPAVFKRAGLDYFLSNLSKDYEIVLYSNSMPTNNPELITFKIDPQGNYLSSQLFSDSGLKERGQFSQRVEMLNRDPKKVIFLDTQSYKHPNVINIGKFNPNTRESILINLLPVLSDIAKKKPEDVTKEVQELNDERGLVQSIQHYVDSRNINTNPSGKRK